MVISKLKQEKTVYRCKKKQILFYYIQYDDKPNRFFIYI